MAGNEVDYDAFGVFFNAIVASNESEGEWSAFIEAIQAGAGVTGWLGTESAMSFRATHSQASVAMPEFLIEQMEGKVFLAEAAAAVALAYYDGDLGQGAQVSDVMNGILNPNGHSGTAQEKYFDPESQAAETAPDMGLPEQTDQAPPPTVDEEGNIRDSQGRILFTANGTPGNPQALAEAGITPGENGGDATGTSPYLAYINSVNAASREYYLQYTGVDPTENPEDVPDQYDPDAEELPADIEAMGETFNALVDAPDAPEVDNPYTDTDGDGQVDPPSPPSEQPDLGGYQAPEEPAQPSGQAGQAMPTV